VAGPNAKGERVRLICRVFDGDGVPVNDSMIEIWQANAEGKYQSPDDPQQKAVDPDCPGYVRLATNENGSCVFETIKPGSRPTTKILFSRSYQKSAAILSWRSQTLTKAAIGSLISTCAARMKPCSLMYKGAPSLSHIYYFSRLFVE
jgi:hypothetical protein